MSFKFKPGIRVFVFESIIDLRAGFDRLTHLVNEKMGARLIAGDLFVFFGKNRSKVKMNFFMTAPGWMLVLNIVELNPGRSPKINKISDCQQAS